MQYSMLQERLRSCGIMPRVCSCSLVWLLSCCDEVELELSLSKKFMSIYGSSYVFDRYLGLICLDFASFVYRH